VSDCFACNEQEASGVQSPAVEHTCAEPRKTQAPVEMTLADHLSFFMERADATVGSHFIGLMSSDAPRPENFAALGRIIRAARREDLEEALRRRAR
jgi:hypothetical protein